MKQFITCVFATVLIASAGCGSSDSNLIGPGSDTGTLAQNAAPASETAVEADLSATSDGSQNRKCSGDPWAGMIRRGENGNPLRPEWIGPHSDENIIHIRGKDSTSIN
jgi:hypothetical protein